MIRTMSVWNWLVGRGGGSHHALDRLRVERDLTRQKLELDIPADSQHRPFRLAPSLADLRGEPKFVSAAALMHKAKRFDDGLYAAVELAALHGGGNRPAKTAWLARLRDVLEESPAATALYAAARVLDPVTPVPAVLADAVDRRVSSFLADERRSKPLSFYAWTEDLVGVFRHDRLLQAELSAAELAPLVDALHAHSALRAEYERYLGLIERLTNPLVDDGLRSLLRALDEGTQPLRDKGRLFPPSAAHETELGKRLYGDAPIPAEFDLMAELIARVRARDLDLEPTTVSGWYDHQVWSLEPLVVPEGTAEAARLRFADEYRSHLEDLFRAAWAMARETHVKQLEIPDLGAAPRLGFLRTKPKLVVCPELTCEPLPTHYRRRADAYRFVRQVVEDCFGADALRLMHRQTAAGPVEPHLHDELTFMTRLFDGAAARCEREIGASAAALTSDEETFAGWSPHEDADLGADIRAMVPVFYDVERGKTKVWVLLGWSTRNLKVSFVDPPSIVVRDPAGNDVTARCDFEFAARLYWLAHPEFAEVYVDRILDRDEFRELCDRLGTRDKILAAL